MSTYENAPATKLLATNCACCGRALIDAESVEAGIGPDCRAKYGIDNVANEAAREEANRLVHAVAKKGMTHASAEAAFTRLAELGYITLATRIAKRFRATLTASPTAPTKSVGELRAEFAKVRADMCYDNCSLAAFNLLVRAAAPTARTPSAEEWVAIATELQVTCQRCQGTGEYRVGRKTIGECFRCGGKGRQTLEDARRNRAWDKHATEEATKAMLAG